jgi:hypothetical protein
VQNGEFRIREQESVAHPLFRARQHLDQLFGLAREEREEATLHVLIARPEVVDAVDPGAKVFEDAPIEAAEDVSFAQRPPSSLPGERLCAGIKLPFELPNFDNDPGAFELDDGPKPLQASALGRSDDPVASTSRS